MTPLISLAENRIRMHILKQFNALFPTLGFKVFKSLKCHILKFKVKKDNHVVVYLKMVVVVVMLILHKVVIIELFAACLRSCGARAAQAYDLLIEFGSNYSI